MFCIHCGAKLEEGSRFCTSCGRSLDEGQTQVMPPSNNVRGAASWRESGNVRPASAWQPAAKQQPAQSYYNYTGAAQEPSARGPIIALAVAAALVAIAAVVVMLVIRPFDPVGRSTVSDNSATSAQQAQKSGQASSAAAPNVLPREESSSGAAATAEQPSTSSAKSSSAASAKSGDYLLPDSDSRYLSRSEVQNMSLYDLYLARNEIYARHGRGFKNQDLRDYFGKKSWYHERYNPAEFDKMDLLNDYEKKNADLMLSVEKSRNSPYL